MAERTRHPFKFLYHARLKMMKIRNLIAIGILSFLSLSGCAVFRSVGLYHPPPAERIAEFRSDVVQRKFSFELPPRTRVDTVRIDSIHKVVEVHFNDAFSMIPYRNENVKEVYRQIESYFDGTFNGYTLSVRTLRRPIEQLVPNIYRGSFREYDRLRLPLKRSENIPAIVRNISKPRHPGNGLAGRTIGLWNSHGWYYNRDLDRWEWQRPRLFQMVEDLIPTSFVLPYLVPTLEQAGANVFVPRERDFQTNEVLVDNDSASTGYSETVWSGSGWRGGRDSGFAVGTPPYGPGVNPFRQGTYRSVPADTIASAGATWTPLIPENGEYAVYVSYGFSEENAGDARYTVHHLGGQTEFLVDQQIGGGTWIYLGTFKFAAGRDRETGSVVLTNDSRESGRTISADAVRFGGGMGIIARNGKTSGRPKYVEGSRYYLQFVGMPDSLVYDLSGGRDDYRDDYQSRAEYLNYLTGAPLGPNKKRDEKGLGIPIDLSLAFHTDAGITDNDTTIGTLSIYSIQDLRRSTVFPDSVSRLANRDLADIVQTQVVDDIRAKYDPAWRRRQLRNAEYSEATRPNMPSLLLELLSHQNFLDMKFVLDPRFRFDVARAIYKGILRFLASERNAPYVVQPLPVTHVAAELDGEENALLRWKARLDPLEPSASPTHYLVYTRLEDGGFDNGILVGEPKVVIRNLKPGTIYSFKITAVNDGGESFPSEIVAVCRQPDGPRPVLIVNGFHRISGPAAVGSNGLEGFMPGIDRGVPDRYELGYTGEQFDFVKASLYRSNDGPGHGASYADNEGKPIAGNSFDYPFLHGSSLRDCGLSFCSASSEAVIDSMVRLTDFTFVDLILGKEKETHWPKAFGDSAQHVQFRTFPRPLQEAIRTYTEQGGNLFISGAYAGSDLFSHPREDSTSIRFAWKVLHFDWSTGHASKSGKVFSVHQDIYPKDKILSFNTELNRDIYAVEAPDALVPHEGSQQIFRYAENQFGAAVGYKKSYGVVVMGFPFETVLGGENRTELMKGILKYLRVTSR